MSSNERMADQTVGSDQGSGMSKHSKLTHWDVKPMIPIPFIQPRRDVTKELRPGGSTSRLTSLQLTRNEQQEQSERGKRDHQAKKE